MRLNRLSLLAAVPSLTAAGFDPDVHLGPVLESVGPLLAAAASRKHARTCSEAGVVNSLAGSALDVVRKGVDQGRNSGIVIWFPNIEGGKALLWQSS